MAPFFFFRKVTFMMPCNVKYILIATFVFINGNYLTINLKLENL